MYSGLGIVIFYILVIRFKKKKTSVSKRSAIFIDFYLNEFGPFAVECIDNGTKLISSALSQRTF